MSTRSGSYGHKAIEFQAQLDKYIQFVKNNFPETTNNQQVNKVNDQEIKFLDGTDPKLSPVSHFTLISTDKVETLKYFSIKFILYDLVDESAYKWIQVQVNIFHDMKLKLSKLFFGYILFKYDTDLDSLIDLTYALSDKSSGLTDFLHSVGNAMNGNYVHITSKETFLTQYNVLDFIVDYMSAVRYQQDEKISKNKSSSQIIHYIADQFSVNIQNTIKKNTKILIRIYIEEKMQLKKKKKSIRLQNKDIPVRDQLRNQLYVQRKIIQSVIFQYPIEVIFTYLHSFYHYITFYLFYIYLFFITYTRMMLKLKDNMIFQT